MRRALAIFDVDGTLVPPPGAEVRFARFLRARGQLTPTRVAAYALRIPLRLLVDGVLAFKRNKAYLNGMGGRALEELADAFVDGQGPEFWNADVLARLEMHRAQGDRVLLLTGTPDVVARAMAHRLAVAWEASVLDRRDGRVTARAPRQHPHGRSKLAIARRVASAWGCPLEEAWAYGDAWADRHLLSSVGHPVAVHPGPRLLRLARQRGWEVIGPDRRRPAGGIRTSADS
ncbi:MAG: haloacid dehalogenase-like hydrolase [Chromatiales bacterium]|jgi:phosphoserine phosphatase